MFPFPSTEPKPPRPPRTTTGLDPEDRGKMILLGVAFLFVLALAGGLYPSTRSQYAPPPKTGTTVPGTKDGVVLDISPAPLFPEEEAEEIQRILLERMAKLAPIAQGTAAVDPEPYEYLVDQATLNARILN